MIEPLLAEHAIPKLSSVDLKYKICGAFVENNAVTLVVSVFEILLLHLIPLMMKHNLQYYLPWFSQIHGMSNDIL